MLWSGNVASGFFGGIAFESGIAVVVDVEREFRLAWQSGGLADVGEVFARVRASGLWLAYFGRLKRDRLPGATNQGSCLPSLLKASQWTKEYV